MYIWERHIRDLQKIRKGFYFYEKTAFLEAFYALHCRYWPLCGSGSAIIILIVIVLSIIQMLRDLTQMSLGDLQTGFFTGFLSRILTFAVGVEFVRMLCKHTADTIVDVLLFATARQMVVEHLDPMQTLLCVLAIGGLFAIRKYLLLSSRAACKGRRPWKIPESFLIRIFRKK